jgi:hypothetical protein
VAKPYSINCYLCTRIHIPKFGPGGIVAAVAEPKDKDNGKNPITYPYICPISGKNGQVTFPYDPEIAELSILGWEQEE